MSKFMRRLFSSDEIFFLLTLYNSRNNFNDYIDLDELYYMNIDMRYFPMYMQLILKLGIVKKIDFSIYQQDTKKQINLISQEGDFVVEKVVQKYMNSLDVSDSSLGKYQYFGHESFEYIDDNNIIEINLNVDKSHLRNYMIFYFNYWENSFGSDIEDPHELSEYEPPREQMRDFIMMLKTYSNIYGTVFKYGFQGSEYIDEYTLLFYFYINDIIKLRPEPFYMNDKSIEVTLDTEKLLSFEERLK